MKESVNRILNEVGDTPRGRYMLGRLQQRARQRGDTALDDELSDKYEKGWHNNSDGRAWNSGMDDEMTGADKETIQQNYNMWKKHGR